MLIICAGMPRSGSTWLYNAVRLAFVLSGNRVEAGWIHDYINFRKKGIVILKTHFHPSPTPPDFCFYSYRDVRDVIASFKRQSGRLYSFVKVKQIISLFEYWRDIADFSMKYESMMRNPDEVVEILLSTLNINLPVKQVLDEIDKLESPPKVQRWNLYNKENLLHPGHITNGGSNTWKDIDPSLIHRVEKTFESWFIRNGYSLRGEV